VRINSRFRVQLDEISALHSLMMLLASIASHPGYLPHWMQSLMAAARAAAIRTMYGDVPFSNHSMLRFVAKLGFVARPDAGNPQVTRVEINL